MISRTDTREYIIAGIGELLWDMLPGNKRLGGAPANFAIHTRAMGANAAVVSAIGDDEPGDELLSVLDSKRIAPEFVTRNAQPTGCVNVELDRDGNPSYDIARDAAWDFLQFSPRLQRLAETCDAVCFGSLAQRSSASREAIHRFVSATGDRCLRIFDINLRQEYFSKEIITASLTAANVLKLNTDELHVLIGLLDLPKSTVEALQTLLHRFDLKCIALTRGAAGSVMMTASDLVSCPGLPAVVHDTVGAGDSFTAAMAVGLLLEMPLDTINTFAGKVAAYVCSQPGATPELPACLTKELAGRQKSRIKSLPPLNAGGQTAELKAR